jgi:hypothetical protein
VTLRQRLGGDERRVHEQLDALLDSEDGIILLADTQRAVSYAQGFALSPAQLELLTFDIERAIRAVTSAHVAQHKRGYPTPWCPAAGTSGSGGPGPLRAVQPSGDASIDQDRSESLE